MSTDRGNSHPSSHAGWIVSPAFDLLFFANLWWLVLGLPWWRWESASPLSFWQVYFLTTPHRWITLLLVTTDPDRREGRGKLFLAIAVFFAAVVCGFRSATGAFYCLAMMDYVWNAWHFGSQHGGILRIYARKSGGGRPRRENYITRTFVTYSILRVAGWTIGWEDVSDFGGKLFLWLDIAMVAMPVGLLVTELRAGPRDRLGKIAYLSSVTLLYTALIVAVRGRHTAWTTLLVPAHAAFHATEYLAIVTYYAWRRSERGSESLFREMARNWAFTLVAFVVFLGTFSQFVSTYTAEFWVGLNLWAAFLHYSYDGMIWKLRRQETASTLGVE